MSGKYKNIVVSFENEIFTIILNRPEKRNAINEQTMDELGEALDDLGERIEDLGQTCSMAIIKAEGKDFSAGADLQWMKSTQQMNVDEIQQQNMKLQKVFEKWYELPVFTVARLKGNVVGGAIGLTAASDLVVAHHETVFRFSEVSLGLIPATIAPFILFRTKSRFIKNSMLTALPFNAQQALNTNLIDVIADDDLCNSILGEYKASLVENDPQAIGECKKLLNRLEQNNIEEPLDYYTTRLLAELRRSKGAAERIDMFFKRSDKKNQ